MLGNSGLHDLYLGEFNIAKTRTQEGLTILLARLESDDEQVLNAYNNMGLVLACQGEYKRGLDFLGRAEEILRINPEKYPTKSLLLNANYGRNYYCMGEYEESEKRLDVALAEATEMDSLVWKIVLHQAYASLFCRKLEYSTAEEHLRLSAEGIEELGSSSLLQITALQAYRLGRLTFSQGNFKDSMKHFQKAEDIDEVNKSPHVYHARNIYGLSRAMRSMESSREEGEQLLVEALSLLKLHGGAKSEETKLTNDNGFEVFDLLVRIIER